MTTRGPSSHRAHAARGVQGAGHPRPTVREGAAADGREGNRRHGSHWQGAARAPDRRPRHGQGIPCHGRDHQPEGQRRDLRLRCGGQKASMVAGIVEALRSRGAMEHTIIVAATAAEPRPCSTSPPTRAARWPSTSCTRSTRTRCACTTTFRGRQTPTASSPSCCAARPARGVSRATCSTCTRGCWNAPRAFPTSWAADLSPRFP